MALVLNPVPRPDISHNGTLKPPWQSWFAQLYTYLTASSSGGGGLVPNTRNVNTGTPLSGGGALSSDLTLSLNLNGVTNAYLAQMAAGTIKGNNGAGTANALDLTATQVTAMLSQFTSTLQGLVPASGGGTANFLRADGSFAVPPGTGAVSPANPTAVVGASAVNGSAATFMRSDAAPGIDLTFTPTWTGLHTFSAGLTAKNVTVNGTTVPANGLFLNSANVLSFSSNSVARGTIDTNGQWIINTPTAATAAALSITAAVGQAALRLTQAASSTGVALIVAGASTSGSSFGANVFGGTTSADYCAQFLNAAGTGNAFLKLLGDGSVQLGQVATTTTAPGAGGAGALPATPAGFFTITIGTRVSKVAYY